MLSKVLPAVQGTCSLLSAKLSYSKHEGMSFKHMQRKGRKGSQPRTGGRPEWWITWKVLANNNLLDRSTVLQRHVRINGTLTFDPIRNWHGSDSKSPASLRKRKRTGILRTIMHHAKRSQQPLHADQSGHVFFPQSSIALESLHVRERAVSLQVVCS